MFLFENLVEVDDRSIQRLLQEVDSESLLIALKGAEQPLREKFLRNMSQRGEGRGRQASSASTTVHQT